MAFAQSPEPEALHGVKADPDAERRGREGALGRPVCAGRPAAGGPLPRTLTLNPGVARRRTRTRAARARSALGRPVCAGQPAAGGPLLRTLTLNPCVARRRTRTRAVRARRCSGAACLRWPACCGGALAQNPDPEPLRGAKADPDAGGAGEEVLWGGLFALTSLLRAGPCPEPLTLNPCVARRRTRTRAARARRCSGGGLFALASLLREGSGAHSPAARAAAVAGLPALLRRCLAAYQAAAASRDGDMDDMIVQVTRVMTVPPEAWTPNR